MTQCLLDCFFKGVHYNHEILVPQEGGGCPASAAVPHHPTPRVWAAASVGTSATRNLGCVLSILAGRARGALECTAHRQSRDPGDFKGKRVGSNDGRPPPGVLLGGSERTASATSRWLTHAPDKPRLYR